MWRYLYDGSDPKAAMCTHWEKSPNRKVLLPPLVKGLREYNLVQSSCFSSHGAVLVHPSPSPIRQAPKSQFNNKEHSDVKVLVNNPSMVLVRFSQRKENTLKPCSVPYMRESIEGAVVVPDVTAPDFLKFLEYLCLDDFVLDELDGSLERVMSVSVETHFGKGYHYYVRVMNFDF